MKNDIKCYGCKALVEDIPGTAHKYIGANQGCWNLYTEVLAKQYSEFNYPEDTQRLTVDTYAIQHPGVPSKQSIQSVNIHLISLYAVLIKKLKGKQATKMIGEILKKEPRFEWLEPPVPNGQITVIDVLKATNKEEHGKIVEEWAGDVFNCWYSKYRDIIENNAETLTKNFETKK